MRAAVIGPDAAFRVETLDDPVPGPGELVLRVTGCGICGSDLKARPAMPSGTVMGHELCGEVVAVGTGTAAEWREGVRAAVLPVFSCGRCAWCRAGDVAHCAEASLMGLGGCAGGFAELVRARAELSFRLPDGLPRALRAARRAVRGRAPHRPHRRHRRPATTCWSSAAGPSGSRPPGGRATSVRAP